MNQNLITIDGGRSLVNMDNVTNIAFLDKTNRIVFNFNNNIEIKTSNGIQVIADYRYDNHDSVKTYADKKQEIIKYMKEHSFIEPVYPEQDHHWVNPIHITFINVDRSKNRLMFNLSNSVTKPIKGEIMLVNDFVFWNHNEANELENSVNIIFDKLS